MTPPATGGDGDGHAPVDPGDKAAGAGEPNPVSVALRELTPPEHGPSFWGDLDRRLADEPQLRLAPRAAIRPITQPPPVIDDRKLAEHLAGPRPRAGGWRPLRYLAWGVAIAVTALLIAAALYDPDDETRTADPADTATTSATADVGQSTTTTAPPTTTTAPGTVDASAPLAPDGVGPLRINTTFRDLQAAGVALTVDQATFEGSGGSCYDARVTGSLDLLLRFRSPVPGEGLDDPADGVLAAVGIDSGLPTTRTSDKGIGLGAPQDQVLATYAGNLEDHSHPYTPGGHVFIAPAAPETGLAIAYLTDGSTVNQVTVGAHDIVRYVDGCF
ncbi:MAG: hypothetical protein ACRD07_01955 [Acidimicrobiales bacterium]